MIPTRPSDRGPSSAQTPVAAPASSGSTSVRRDQAAEPAPDPDPTAAAEPDPDDPYVRAVGTWEVDVAHSEVEFLIRHLMSRVRGSFTDFHATVTVPSTDFSDASVEATIQVGSLTTHNEERDAHVRSADFFVQTQPTITFRSTEILPAPRAKYQRADSNDDYTIVGELTINGITHEVDLDSEFLGVDVDDFGTVRLGVSANTQINKRDYGVNFNVPLDGDKLLLGDKIDIDLSIQATRT